MKTESYYASDYAGMEGPDFKLYYGYEETVPEEAPDESEDYDAYQEWEQEHEWAFVARYKGVEVERIKMSDLGVDGYDQDTREYLMAGSAIFIQNLIEGKYENG